SPLPVFSSDLIRHFLVRNCRAWSVAKKVYRFNQHSVEELRRRRPVVDPSFFVRPRCEKMPEPEGGPGCRKRLPPMGVSFKIEAAFLSCLRTWRIPCLRLSRLSGPREPLAELWCNSSRTGTFRPAVSGFWPPNAAPAPHWFSRELTTQSKN